jgi:hypothetical protein
LNTWTLKIQELDLIRDYPATDREKRAWVTSTLQTHEQMYDAIIHAGTIEHTLAGLNETKTKFLRFEKFFDLCLTTAKHLDKHTQVNNKKSREINVTAKQKAKTTPAAPGRGNNSAAAKPKSTYIDPAIWAKMTPEAQQAHRNKSAAARATRIAASKAARIAKAAATTAAATPTPAPAPIPVPAAASAPLSAPAALGIREMLSNTANRSVNTTDILVDGHTYRYVSHTNILYHVQSYAIAQDNPGSLIDGGANGGFAGSDVRLIELTNDKADVSGIGSTVIKDLDIGTVAGLIETTSGPIIGIFHQYAYHGKGKTIHAPNQFRAFDIEVNETPLRSPCGHGKQQITTPEGYCIPLKIRQGLPYMKMCAPNELELESYPHVIFTSDMPWDPTIFDDDAEDHDLLGDDPLPLDPLVNQFGEVIERVAQAQVIHKHSPNLEAMRPYFGWTPLDRIKHTLDATTQFARADTRLPMRKHFKTR